jgi:hypothetical protein
VIVYFGQFLHDYRNSPQFRAAVFPRIDNVLILTKTGVDVMTTNFGDFCPFSAKTIGFFSQNLMLLSKF